VAIGVSLFLGVVSLKVYFPKEIVRNAHYSSIARSHPLSIVSINTVTQEKQKITKYFIY
jgi:hypothetical protein